jgi:hypothetical protein
MANSKSHGQQGKTKSQSHTKETDSHVRKRGSKNGAPASSQNQPEGANEFSDKFLCHKFLLLF